MSNSSVVAVIPAFNEEKGIANVLSILRQADWIAEIIVVDDGSKDNTSKIVNEYQNVDSRIKIVRHSSNLGKGNAVFAGLQQSCGEIILTLDADLIGLKKEYLKLLVEPVINGEFDMTLGIFRKGKWDTDLSHFLTPWLTGQRCLPKRLFQAISWEAAAGYGIETAITIAAKQQGWRCEKVYWIGVSHPTSETRRGIIRGFINRIRMYIHIIRAWVIAGHIWH